MKRLMTVVALAAFAHGGTMLAAGASQEQQVQAMAKTLATVRIPAAVQADDQRLSPGTYTVRLTGEAVEAAAGETPSLEQWVEFRQGSTVRGKAVASIVTADAIQQVAESKIPANGTARVERLKSGDYLRVWIRQSGTNYLIHLPLAAANG
jgi:hypothetical protein